MYLSEEEFRRRSRERFDAYYAMLAIAALQLPDKKFWQYHRAKLALLGMPLDRWRLARAVGRRVAVLLSNPGELVSRLRSTVAVRSAKRGRRVSDQNG